jgi:hypothetical protein
MKRWSLVIGTVIGAVVFGVAAFAAVPLVASAQSGATTTPSAPNATPAPDTTTFAPHDGGPRGGFPGRHDDGDLISAAASVTGLTTQAVTTQLQAG